MLSSTRPPGAAVARGARGARGVRGDGGYLTIWVALLLPVLIGMAALGVDVGMWYVSANEQQKAADAAAKAAVPWLPGNVAGATTAAQQVAGRNGFANGGDVTVTPEQDGDHPTRMRVTISKTLNNAFGPVLGIAETTVTRTAVADYMGPVAMGSPCNQFGRNPEPVNAYVGSACADYEGNFWASTASPNSQKGFGDAYQARVCATGDDGCPGGVNTEYESTGHLFVVRVTATLPSLTIQAFDPAMVEVGPSADNCTDNLLAVGSGRYNAGVTNPFCTADERQSGASSGQLTSTRFAVYGPVVGRTVPASPRLGCNEAFPGHGGSITYSGDLPTDLYLLRVFRQWVTICNVTESVPPGDYVIRVTTNGNGSDGAAGLNRFSLRAYADANQANSNSIALFGGARMSVFANLPDLPTEFPLLRLPSGAGGHSLRIRLFDLGDGSDPTSTLQILPPAGGPATYSGCSVPAGDPAQSIDAQCRFRIHDEDEFKGKWQEVTVPIPSNYSCNEVDPAACWVRILLDYDGVQRDVTSWEASVDGNPVRLVE
jgi:Flp pilus assembly protein TadG